MCCSLMPCCRSLVALQMPKRETLVEALTRLAACVRCQREGMGRKGLRLSDGVARSYQAFNTGVLHAAHLLMLQVRHGGQPAARGGRCQLEACAETGSSV